MSTGFWIAIPLAMLSFTGAWISFPAFFGRDFRAVPAGGRRRSRSRPAGTSARGDRYECRRGAGRGSAARAGHVVSIAWPTDQAPEWKIGFARQGGPAEVKIEDASGTVTPPKPPQPETLARTMRRWHDGTGMGPVWQIIIFLGGIAPALLAITGIIMWLRSRGWRAEAPQRSGGRAPDRNRNQPPEM